MKLCAKVLHRERREPILAAGKGWGQELLRRAGWLGKVLQLGWAGLMEIQESPKGFGQICNGEQMGNIVLVHLDRCCVVERMGCRIFMSPSWAGFASWVCVPLCVCAPAGMDVCAQCVQTCVCVARDCAGMCVPVFGSPCRWWGQGSCSHHPAAHGFTTGVAVHWEEDGVVRTAVGELIAQLRQLAPRVYLAAAHSGG